jgi:predicted P-loop ATPase
MVTIHPFPPKDWTDRLRKNKAGVPKPILYNAGVALRDAPAWLNSMAFDDFAKRTVVTAQLPWEMHDGSPRNWTDHDDLKTTEWLQEENILVNLNVAANAVEMVAKERKFHPVHDYLHPLEWDGTKRLANWMWQYAGAANDAYTRAVSRATLIGAVARVFRPGCKVDNMPIFEGLQGIGKSSMAKALFEPWFADELADLGSKDSAMQTQGVWCLEIAELDAMSKSEVSRIKAFISRTTDRFRPPFGRNVEEFARQNVFWGTTNTSDYLKDPTGARRSWPVQCTKLDVAGLAQVRDALWAEAVAAYLSGEKWWFTDAAVLAQAEVEQAGRYQGDLWEGPIETYLSTRIAGHRIGDGAKFSGVAITSILLDVFGYGIEKHGQTEMNRVARILRSLGWTLHQVRGNFSKRSRAYFPPEPDPPIRAKAKPAARKTAQPTRGDNPEGRDSDHETADAEVNVWLQAARYLTEKQYLN